MSARLPHEPDVAQEVEDRRAQAAKLEALFRSRPLEDIEPDELLKITRHYQQRISIELRKGLKMRIVNVPRWIELADGTRKRQDGCYRWEPNERLGRDSGTFVDRPWDATGPFVEEFRLKP